MVKIMEIENLNYDRFENINLVFNKKCFYSIIGCNNSGKTTLFRLISGLIITNNSIVCNGIYLNRDNLSKYLQNIGIVERVNKDSFIYQKVLDEMRFPLYNLGYSKKSMDNRINKVLEEFNMNSIKNKNINDLDYYEKTKLLIMLSLLHKPSVLLLDNVLSVFSGKEKKLLIEILKRFISDEKITIINFTLDLSEGLLSSRLVLVSNFKIIGEYLPSKIYEDDQLFYQNNLEIPFLTDLSIKLKMYGLVNKNYTELKEMVDDIWP